MAYISAADMERMKRFREANKEGDDPQAKAEAPKAPEEPPVPDSKKEETKEEESLDVQAGFSQDSGMEDNDVPEAEDEEEPEKREEERPWEEDDMEERDDADDGREDGFQPSDVPPADATMPVLSGEGVKSRVKPPSGKKRYIRELPDSLVRMCMAACGNATSSNAQAVEAFLYAFRDRRFDIEISYDDVSEKAKEMASLFDLSKDRDEWSKRTGRILSELRDVSGVQDRLLWAVVYMIWHFTGFRKDHPEHPDEIGFSQSMQGFDATLKALDAAVSEYESFQKKRNGRPIR